VHIADLELGGVTTAWHAIVRGALRDGPRLFHVVHLEVTERDVSGVAEAATYSVSAVFIELGTLVREAATYLRHLAGNPY